MSLIVNLRPRRWIVEEWLLYDRATDELRPVADVVADVPWVTHRPWM
jgi:hypothetical protein